MPTTVTGSAGGYAPTSTFSTTTAAALEAPAASQIITPVQDLADAVEYGRTLGFYVYANVTTWTLGGIWHENGSSAKTRIYHGVNGVWCRVHNAEWDEAGPDWTADDAALKSTRERYGADGKMYVEYKAAGAAPWADGAWVTNLTLDSQTGDITATGAQFQVASVSASTGLVCTAGEIAASAGKVQAQGDPALDEARVECKQFVSTTGGAPTASKGNALDNGVGDGTATVVAGSTDIKGRLTLITGAAVNAASGQNITVVTFNKAYPTAPEVMIWPTNVSTADLGTQPFVSTSTTTFTITIGATALTAGGTTYGWAYHVIG